MRTIALGLFCVALVPQAAFAAAEPAGEWLVKDKTAHIRIADCAGTFWGVVSWEAHPGIDDKNPDRQKRGRPTLGIPVLLGLKPAAANRWEGAIYNAENGKTYSGGISMKNADRLHVQGCVLGFLCGGEDWTRLPAAAAASDSDAGICARVTR